MQANSNQPEVFSPQEAARFLGVGKNAVYDAVNRGAIPSRRIGRRILISRMALEKWLEGTRAA